MPVLGIARRSALIIAGPAGSPSASRLVQLDDGDVEAAGRGVRLDRLAPVGGLLDLEVGVEELAHADARDGVAVHDETSTIVAQLRCPLQGFEEGL